MGYDNNTSLGEYHRYPGLNGDLSLIKVAEGIYHRFKDLYGSQKENNRYLEPPEVAERYYEKIRPKTLKDKLCINFNGDWKAKLTGVENFLADYRHFGSHRKNESQT